MMDEDKCKTCFNRTRHKMDKPCSCCKYNKKAPSFYIKYVWGSEVTHDM